MPAAAALPLAAKVGIGIGGALLSKKANDLAQPVASPTADLQAQLAQKLFQQTDPLRTGLIDRSQNFLENGVGFSPQYAAYKSALEPQYMQAKDAIIGSTPAGGSSRAALLKAFLYFL